MSHLKDITVKCSPPIYTIDSFYFITEDVSQPILYASVEMGSFRTQDQYVLSLKSHERDFGGHLQSAMTVIR